MATIDKYLDDIKNKTYGEDVRDAIHDGILQCYQDSTANAQIERIIEKGRETFNSIPENYSTLTAEVDDLKAALSQETDNLIEIGFESLPKNGINATVKPDGIHLYGISTINTAFRIRFSEDVVFPAGEYKIGLSESISGTGAAICVLNVGVSPNVIIKQVSEKGFSTFTLSTDTLVRFVIVVSSSATFSDLVIKPMCVNGTIEWPRYYIQRITAYDGVLYNKITDIEKILSLPNITTFDQKSIVENFEDGRKNIISISGDQIIERIYDTDGITLLRTRTTTFSRNTIVTENT